MIDDQHNPSLVPEAMPAAPEPPIESAQLPVAITIGERLRTARLAQGRTLAECAGSLHLPIKVLERLEAGDAGEPEHFVFLRGALQGYARHLGLPADSCNQALRAAAPAEQPRLVSVARTSPTRWLLQRYGTAATYVVFTAFIAVPLVFLGLRGGLERPITRIVSLDQAPAAAAQGTHVPGLPSAKATAKASPTTPDATPFRASMAPFAAIGLGGGDESSAPASISPAPALVPEITSGQHALTVSASADCWFEIVGADGSQIDAGMLHAGDSRTWHAAGELHVTLGNASAVAVARDGQPLALDAYQRANVAHFDVFAPAAGASDNQ